MSGNILDKILVELKEVNEKQSKIFEKLEAVEKYSEISNLEKVLVKILQIF